jgi:hypothetical protein
MLISCAAPLMQQHRVIKQKYPDSILLFRVGNYDVKVIIATYLGREYLKTESDTTTVDNLLSLPDCR